MKTKFWKAAAAVLMGAAFLATSCVEEELKPEFPAEVQNLTGQLGGSVEIALDPNLAWELSLSTDETLFWFEQNEVKSTTMSGVAGETTATVHITDQPSYTEDYVCNVTLTMDGLSQVIAVITVPKAEVAFKIYPALEDTEWGGWAYDGYDPSINDYKYIYSEEPLNGGIELVYDAYNYNYNVPVKIVSDFDWSIAAPDGADWFEPISGEAGETKVKFATKANNFPAGGANITLAAALTNAPVSEVTVNISVPNYLSTFNCNDFPTGIAYVECEGAGFASVYCDAANGTVPVLFEVDAEGTYSVAATEMDKYGYIQTSWFEVGWNGFGDENLISQASFSLVVSESTQEDVKLGGIALIPEDAEASSIIAADGKGIAEGIAHLTIMQVGTVELVEGPVASVKTNEDMVEDKASFAYIYDKGEIIYRDFDCSYAYRVIKANTDPIALTVTTENYTYEVCHVDSQTGAMVAVPEEWWVNVEQNGTNLSISLDPITGNAGYSDNEADNIYAQDYVGYYVAWVVIKDADGNIAGVIECQFNETARFGDIPPIEIVSSLPSGVTFLEKTLETMDETMKEMIGEMIVEQGIKKIYELRIPSSVVASEDAPLTFTVLIDAGMLQWYGMYQSLMWDWVNTLSITDTSSAGYDVAFKYDASFNTVDALMYVIIEGNGSISQPEPEL